MKLAICVSEFGIRKLEVPDDTTPETVESLRLAKNATVKWIIFVVNGDPLPDVLHYIKLYGEWQ